MDIINFETMNSKVIVITSIYQPTEAVKAFACLEEYSLFVVGDKKTPSSWNCERVRFISIEEQERYLWTLSKSLPYNHYCRKMIGYLEAISDGYKYIIDSDDDNIPKANWSFPVFDDKYDSIPGGKGFINIYQLYTNKKIWARGLPLRMINQDFNLEADLAFDNISVGIWQGLADENPDVDAIYRLTDDSPCYFSDRNPVVLGKGTISPFNTQNTIFRSELFPLLYLPTFVTFRFTDILRGLVAQPIMWLYDFHLGFTNATVVQKRNPHDYMSDFESEIPMFRLSEKVVDVVTKSITANQSMANNLFNAYLGLQKQKIVVKQEMKTLESWLTDLQMLGL